MSYSIVFETKIIKLPDGRILHLSLDGCNNDTQGRRRDEFSGKIYTEKEFLSKIEMLKQDSKPSKEDNGFDMKIRSKYVTWYDYGEHLLRMLKRATTWQELADKYRICRAVVFEGVTIREEGKEKVFLKPREWEKVCYDFWYGRRKGRCTSHYNYLRDIVEIMNALDSKESMLFHIEN